MQLHNDGCSNRVGIFAACAIAKLSDHSEHAQIPKSAKVTLTPSPKNSSLYIALFYIRKSDVNFAHVEKGGSRDDHRTSLFVDETYSFIEVAKKGGKICCEIF